MASSEIGRVHMTVGVSIEPTEEFDNVASALGYRKGLTCVNDGVCGKFVCSECGAIVDEDHYFSPLVEHPYPDVPSYCPFCGARVVSGNSE
jgi:DNA-directed RNA polymerase subunit RPC12/RpoP